MKEEEKDEGSGNDGRPDREGVQALAVSGGGDEWQNLFAEASAGGDGIYGI